jgi:chromosomal replication initiation ATPase DnaA
MHFGTWVACQANHSALEIAQSIARDDAPPEIHNPLYIHSAPGLGKTHLLSAIANRHGRDVLLINVAQLASGLTRAGQSGTVTHLRDWLTSTRTLLLDDLQTCEGNGKLQKVLQRAVGQMLGSGRRVVVTADVPPRGLRRIRSGLVSYVGLGTIVELRMGSAAERLEVLRAMPLPVPVDDDVLRRLADSIEDSVGRLKAVATRTAQLALQRGEPPSAALADDALLAESGHPIAAGARPSRPPAAPPSPRALGQAVLERFEELERHAESAAEVPLALQIAINEQIRELRSRPLDERESLDQLRRALGLARAGNCEAALEVVRPLI